MQKGRPSSNLFLTKHGVHGRSLQKAAAELHTCITVYNWAGLLKKLWILRKNKGRKPSQQPQLTAPNSPKSPQRSGCIADTRAAAVYRRDSPALSRAICWETCSCGESQPLLTAIHTQRAGSCNFRVSLSTQAAPTPARGDAPWCSTKRCSPRTSICNALDFFSSYPALQLQWQLFLGSPGQHPLCFPKILLKVDKKNLSLISDGKKKQKKKKLIFKQNSLQAINQPVNHLVRSQKGYFVKWWTLYNCL